MNEHRVREEGLETYYVLNTFQTRTDPLPTSAIHAAADMAFSDILTLNHGVLWLFLASYHLLHSVSSQTFHVFSPSARSLPLPFPLSPHRLILITLLLQVASLLFLGISCTSYRNLQNAKEGEVLAVNPPTGGPDAAGEADRESSGCQGLSGTPE